MSTHALFGGSFDPIHNGHLHIAREIVKSGCVDSVVFLPNSRHNFKKGSVLLDFATRFELVKSALGHGMEVWDDDSTGSGYTSDLLQRIYEKYPDHSFYWVIGSDNLASLHTWHDYAWLTTFVRFLVIPRPGFPLELDLLRKIRRKVLQIKPSPVSSTQVRERIAEGKPLKGLVPHALENRIIELYKPLLAKRGKSVAKPLAPAKKTFPWDLDHPEKKRG